MKLNGDIIFAELSKFYSVERYGECPPQLCIGRPEFYMDSENLFESGHLYLATADHLPVRPVIKSGAVLVCIGDSMALNYYRERLLLIQIKTRADFFRVFTALQEIFDKYDDWERGLYRELSGNCDIRAMAESSADIFSYPLYIIDSAFRYVAQSRGNKPSRMLDASSALDPDALSSFLSESDLLTEKHNSFILDLSEIPVLCVNLFSRNGDYEGCIYFELDSSRIDNGEDKLAEKLAEFVQLAMEKIPRPSEGSQGSIKKLLQTLISEQPLTRSQRVVLKSVNNTQSYRCLYIRSSRKHQKLPLSYICDAFEETFAESYAFIHGDAIAAFMNSAPVDDEKARLSFIKGLRSFCGQMRLSAGISNEFSDFFDIRTYYIQAQAAAEDGLLLNPDDTVFFFSSYATTEMVINALGGLPAEAYYPEGLKNILEHDKNSPVSYLETLRIFMEENLSYTAAAQRLFVHRSTLIDRLDRIESEMKLDLKNPEQRLLLEILLKAMDLQETLKQQ